MNEAYRHPGRDQFGLGLANRTKEPEGAVCIGIVALNRIGRKGSEVFRLPPCCEDLESADAQVALCDAGQDGARQRPLFARSFCSFGCSVRFELFPFPFETSAAPIWRGTAIYFEAAMLVAMVGFVSTVAYCRFLLRGDIIE